MPQPTKQMRLSLNYFILPFMALIGCSTNGDSPGPAAKTENRVVFRAADGRELTTADLADATGTFEYEILSNNDIPAKANQLHQQARQLGAAGQYDEAIRLLTEAQTLAPDWPYPTYDMAFSYLLKQDFAKARQCYQKVIELSPRGFFTALTALDTLDREAAGELPEGTYAAYSSLEWVDDPQQKAQLIGVLVERLPSFAPAWKEYALQCQEPAEKLEAIEKGLAANPDAETKGILLINKALTLNQQGDKQAAKEILGSLALDPNASFSNEHLAKQTLAMIAE
ncbi:tetratricopeptide repeat protein [Bremerella sp. P1]|uniref:tetratricopeptide repeat protein n=1 Tax=Bremerella sp. P1 TaxID=3026424 RepID=UPI002368B3FF|nr:tetratricopeptide repeat protein [Bremerella sp. P1]WDI42051.1 tetratricopeptide repeat protein [Bremerella sp. P1]